METSIAQRNRDCTVCHRVVGTYEPAVFVLGDEVIHSSRAAEPELSSQPGCRTVHAHCYAEHGDSTQLRTV